MLARISTKASQCSRQDHHEDDVLLPGKHYTLFSYSLMTQPFAFSCACLFRQNLKWTIKPVPCYSIFLSIDSIKRRRQGKKSKKKKEAYFDKSPWNGHDTCLIVRHWHAVKSFHRQPPCLPLTGVCSRYQAEHEGKLHGYDPTELGFVRLRHKKHSFKMVSDKI